MVAAEIADASNDGDNEMTDAKNGDESKRKSSKASVSSPAFDSENNPKGVLTDRQAAAFRKIYGDHYQISSLVGKITPDCNFDRRDCEMLAILAKKYKDERWLELQAAFFNATGRMVSGEVLKHKLADVMN